MRCVVGRVVVSGLDYGNRKASNVDMDWLEWNDAAFYAFAWSSAFLACLFRSFSDDCYKSFTRSFFISGVSGFVGFSVVAVLVGWSGGGVSGHWSYIAIATLIGLAGKQQDQIIGLLLKKLGLMNGEHGSK